MTVGPGHIRQAWIWQSLPLRAVWNQAVCWPPWVSVFSSVKWRQYTARRVSVTWLTGPGNNSAIAVGAHKRHLPSLSNFTWPLYKRSRSWSNYFQIFSLMLQAADSNHISELSVPSSTRSSSTNPPNLSPVSKGRTQHVLCVWGVSGEGHRWKLSSPTSVTRPFRFSLSP